MKHAADDSITDCAGTQALSVKKNREANAVTRPAPEWDRKLCGIFLYMLIALKLNDERTPRGKKAMCGMLLCPVVDCSLQIRALNLNRQWCSQRA